MPRKAARAALPQIDWGAFPGFDWPQYTPIPDAVVDIFMPELTGAELKCLLYIVRRTFGFKKSRDTITLDQFCYGIVRSGGERLDGGTGLQRSTVSAALKSLADKGLIVAESGRLDPERGTLPTRYALRMRPELMDRVPVDQNRGDRKMTPPEHSNGTGASDRVGPQEIGIQETIHKMDTVPASSSDLWPAVLRDLEQTMTPANYERWYAPSHLLTASGGVLIVAVPDTLRRDYLESKGQAAVTRALRRLGADGQAVRYVVASQA